MLYFNREKSRKIFAGPLLIEIVGFLCLEFPVTINLKSVAVVGSIHFWIGRRFTKSTKVIRKMSMIDHEWIASFRVLIKSFRDQHMCTNKHGLSPKLSEQLALN